MMSTRRLSVAVLCAASLTTAVVAASPAVAVQSTTERAAACGANVADYNGTFQGLFDRAPGDTVKVTFDAPGSVRTEWSVEGWKGKGIGDYTLTSSGVQWTNANTVTGVLNGVDSELYRSVSVTCAAGTHEVVTINGFVESGDSTIPFAVTRTA
ncbi:hypothetical protein OIB37_05485 [Streptomyces sp. NBC_00820]|uniref:hypothetical protein n=1 Tax=Streptomyces sp. NBC_00820 TaxID=2975842 RepID=UPI002ED569DE|nr:hypothetical protein OIB37_05485 [Streptomyces sp. NBC_00820]